jgi:hypothetical protein
VSSEYRRLQSWSHATKCRSVPECVLAILFLRALTAYAPGRRREDVRSLAVTEFYDIEKIKARTAFSVVGSNVVGPMGHEWVP